MFTDYRFEFTSVFYDDPDILWGVAFNSKDNINYLVRYWWNDPNNAPELYPLKGLSNDPNFVPYVGQRHSDSIIYAKNSDSKDF